MCCVHGFLKLGNYVVFVCMCDVSFHSLRRHTVSLRITTAHSIFWFSFLSQPQTLPSLRVYICIFGLLTTFISVYIKHSTSEYVSWFFFHTNAVKFCEIYFFFSIAFSYFCFAFGFGVNSVVDGFSWFYKLVKKIIW